MNWATKAFWKYCTQSAVHKKMYTKPAVTHDGDKFLSPAKRKTVLH